MPELRFGVAALVAVIVAAGGLAGWELHWRRFGVEPSIQNSDGLWARERRRIDHGDGHRTVLVGASRMLFDVDLGTWERVTGERPIQLALEGTSPLFVLEDLATDHDFTGRLIVGVAPDVFFSGFAYRGKLGAYYRDETLAQRAGQWLSMTFLEPYAAFYDPDFALFTVLKRQDWPARVGVKVGIDVRKLSNSAADRDTWMWSKVEGDPEYRALAQKIWMQDTTPPDAKFRAELDKRLGEQIDRAAAAVGKLRARGVEVVFVRFPSITPYRDIEDRDFPRATTWDVLLARTGSPGIHFDDEPSLQGFDLPEWSHLAAGERPRFTEALLGAIARLKSQ
ncbi:MAG: hypothetical protein M3619_26800 [Myxococcota bacterium]|nr:hypothetical protein [Myxococcota bacterium]